MPTASHSIPATDSRHFQSQPFLTSFIFACVIAALQGRSLAADEYPVKPRLETYDQAVVFEFANEDVAARAEFAVAPLFDGHYRAVSCRWDDNWTSDNPQTREVMERHRIKGTWYLNGPNFSPDHPRGDYTEIARQLLSGDNSVGGHSLTHPYLTYFHSNRMFAETAGVRMAWEAVLDRPVCSYAYSFIDLRPQPEDKAVLTRSLATLDRAGIYHLATYVSFFHDVPLAFELSPILPPENSPLDVFQRSVDWAYESEELSSKWPMISNSMHAWYNTERLQYGYDELERRLQTLASLNDVWHCNQNQYAAYRRQYRCTTLTKKRVEGKKVVVVVEHRPSVVDLNDMVPLTIDVSHVEPEEVLTVQCEDAAVVRSTRATDGHSLVQLEHSHNQRLPSQIGLRESPPDSLGLGKIDTGEEFPQLVGSLDAEDDSLQLTLTNNASVPLTNVRITWRTPIGWTTPQFIERVQDLAGTESFEASQPLVPQGSEEARFGVNHFVAQLDFDLGDEHGRLYFTCQQQGAEPGNSWPLDGFSVLGPIPNGQFNLEETAEQIQGGTCPSKWSSENGEALTWRPQARDGYVNHEWLNPEYIRTMGTWDAESETYLLRSQVHSPDNRSVRVIVSHPQLSKVFINGQLVVDGQASLESGDNDLVIVYPGARMSMETTRLVACFLRIANPESGERFSDIRYKPY